MLTKDEAELYDRQIRLWGVNAQSRIRQSKVLMLGFNGVASEVAKILVLAGIDTLTIVDDQPLQTSDITSNLFCRPTADKATPNYRTHAVKAKLKMLNPLVKVNIVNSSILSMKPENYQEHDLVTLHSFLGIDDINNINEICRTNSIKFYVVLDFGFFGFMFNDLGPEFKFSYEGFSQSDADATNRQSGEKKDPISLNDDIATEDVELESSDGEGDSRPKKKMRVHSPAREPVADNSKETRTKLGSLSYVEFKNMISFQGASFTKKTSPILLVSIAMLKFYGQNKHLPRYEDPKEKDEDCLKLKEILESLKKSLNVHDSILKRLDDTWFDYIYDSLSPVCASLGGVAGQDMIRALSNKGIPISNTFSFDGISMNGIVQKIGSSESKSLKSQPIVRDVMCIDSD